jgi:alkanesulfonate monooxygenase SsuD/methylene tetrahydromethanopterin reductase-like flavin-dependent oxidoreductase (luciferase family)
VLLALGRGLAKVEYDGFRIPMGEARERFDEAAEVVRAIETGVCEGDGPFYKQPARVLRPGPMRSFMDRIHTVAATSPESQMTAGKVGGAILSYVTADNEKLAVGLANYRQHFAQYHPGRTPPLPVLTDVTYCHRDADKATEGAWTYIGNAFDMVVDHYEMDGDHFNTTKGYQSYAAGSQAIRDHGREAAIKSYVPTQLWGTPDEIIRRFRERIAITGPYTPNFQFSAGGTPHDEVMAGAELFADKVLPTIAEIVGEAKEKLVAA